MKSNWKSEGFFFFFLALASHFTFVLLYNLITKGRSIRSPLTTQFPIIHPSKQSQTWDPCQGMKGFPKNALSRGVEGHPKNALTKEHERYLPEPRT